MVLVFTAADMDARGFVSVAAIERECRVYNVPPEVRPLITPAFLATLLTLGATVPVAQANETIPAGVYVELQLGRSVENKLSFRFQP